MRRRVNWWWAVTVAAFALWLAIRWQVTPDGRIDYRIYAGAVRSGDGLYQFKYRILGLGFTYPPFAALLFWPLSHLRDHTGEQAWLLVTAAAAVAFLALLVSTVPRRPAAPWFAPVCVAAGLFLMPVMLSFRLGQVNALIALAVVADLVGFRRGWRWSGAGAGMATAVKLTPAVLVPYYWLAGRRRAAVVAAVTGVACQVLAFVLFPGPSRDYWGGEYKATGRVGDLSSGYSNSIRRYLTWTDLPDGVQSLLWVVLVAAVAVVAYRRAVEADRRGNLLAAFTLVMCLSYLASPITWGHHLWFLPAAVLLILADGHDRRRLVVAAALLLTLLDFWDGGEGPITSTFRFLALVAVVVALPIDDGADRPDPADRSEPVPDRSGTPLVPSATKR